MKLFMLAIAFVGTAFARCPNDCNGKGICNAASVCECYANYMGNDCSERLCNFGKAWIDTNLGDLNANGMIDTDQQVYSGYANTLVGEQYDPNYGIARKSNLDTWDEAHFYRECSNKGVCNRKTGLCDCFPGFEGEGCRRMSCPLDCNGHGRCQLIEHEKLNSEYTLWDQDKVQRCNCDPGYSGPDCSTRMCPKGIDPVEFTYSNADSVYKIEFHPLASAAWNSGNLPNGPTFFTLSYTDDFGDVWTTHAITMYHQANCATDPTTKWDPETKSTSNCIVTPFVANPTLTTNFGNVRKSAFLDEFYSTNFLYDSTFVGEQVNNTLKSLPNDKIRAPYVWTAYNPVEFTGKVGAEKSANADKGFLYPAASVPDFDAARGIGNGGGQIDNWWKCHAPETVTSAPGLIKNGKCAAGDRITTLEACSAAATTLNLADKTAASDGQTSVSFDPPYCYFENGQLKFNVGGQNTGSCTNTDNCLCTVRTATEFCSPYEFSGPSAATDHPKYRFPIFQTKSGLNGAGQNSGVAAARYLDCPLWSVCIFIRIQSPEGSKKLGVNYHYKPANYLLKATKAAPTADEAKIDDYEIFYGAEKRGTDKTTGALKLLTLSSVGASRKWIREVDGDPTIAYIDGTTDHLHPCSRRGLCDYDTGKCECFFGYMGNSCHVRTPSEKQGM